MSTDLSTIIVTVIPTLAGLFGLFCGTHTYRDGQILKRKEIIFSLIAEYDESEKMHVAKRILDDYNLNLNEVLGKVNSSPPQKSIDRYYNKSKLKDILRGGVEFDDGEEAIRDSFDSLLAFFGKL